MNANVVLNLFYMSGISFYLGRTALFRRKYRTCVGRITWNEIKFQFNRVNYFA